MTSLCFSTIQSVCLRYPEYENALEWIDRCSSGLHLMMSFGRTARVLLRLLYVSTMILSKERVRRLRVLLARVSVANIVSCWLRIVDVFVLQYREAEYWARYINHTPVENCCDMYGARYPPVCTATTQWLGGHTSTSVAWHSTGAAH